MCDRFWRLISGQLRTLSTVVFGGSFFLLATSFQGGTLAS